MSLPDSVLDQALALPSQDRAELAARLLDSLDNSPPLRDESSWGAELAARMESVRSGTAVILDADEAIDEVLRELQAERG